MYLLRGGEPSASPDANHERGIFIKQSIALLLIEKLSWHFGSWYLTLVSFRAGFQIIYLKKGGITSARNIIKGW